jgi:hypothetical protein
MTQAEKTAPVNPMKELRIEKLVISENLFTKPRRCKIAEPVVETPSTVV